MATSQSILQQLVPGLQDVIDREQFLKSIATEYPYFAAAQLGYVQELINTDAPTTLAKQKASLVWPPLLLEQLILENDFTAIQSLQTDILAESSESVHVDDVEVSSQELPAIEQKGNATIEEDTERYNSNNQIFEDKIPESLETQEEAFSSVMDLASTLVTPNPITTQGNTSSIWTEREKLESSLDTEMNLAASDEENTSDTRQNQNDNTIPSEIFTPRRLEESMTKPQSLQDIFATHSSEEKQHQPVEAKIEPKLAAEEPLIFEPLYTSDYFASQGIKLTEEQIPSDKLGKQLKSFTEWLQTMKSVHPVKINLNISHNKEVTTLAEKSNEEEDIITESMAFAYIAQGKPQKAADIYEKLKLLYPHKSAYFAAELLKLQ